MNHNSDMINLVKLMEGKNQFAGEEVGQKPGDQVRGTDKATPKGTDHPFKGRLVGEDTTLEDVLAKKYADFKDVQAKEKAEKKKEKLENEKEEVDEGAYEDGIRDGMRGEPNRRASSIYGPESGEYDRGYRDGLKKGEQDKADRLAQHHADIAPYKGMSVEELIALRKGIKKRGDERHAIYSKLRGSSYSFDPKRHLPPNHAELAAQNKEDYKAWNLINQELFNRGVNVDKLGESSVDEAANPTDKVIMDVPLMLRMFEYAREDAQTDMDLHDVTERLIKLSGKGRVLTMQDYDTIVGQQREQMVSELGADGSALGSVAAARSQQAALSTKPSPVSPDGKDEPSGTQAGSNLAKPPAVSTAAPSAQNQPLTPDEQDALDKIKANAGLKSQYDRLLKQAGSGV